MLLAFPTGAVIDPLVVSKDTCTVRSVNKSDFNNKLNEKVFNGWVILEMVSKFRKTLFGGITSYYAELRREPSKL